MTLSDGHQQAILGTKELNVKTKSQNIVQLFQKTSSELYLYCRVLSVVYDEWSISTRPVGSWLFLFGEYYRIRGLGKNR